MKKTNYYEKENKKEERMRWIKEYNSSISETAEEYAKDMQKNPSELESRMKQLLDSKNIVYDFQRVFNIKYKNGRIRAFYIADFYVPSSNLIIETDGKFHDKQVEYDDMRTKNIQHSYPNIKVLRWRWNDFRSIRKLKKLNSMLSGK